MSTGWEGGPGGGAGTLKGGPGGGAGTLEGGPGGGAGTLKGGYHFTPHDATGNRALEGASPSGPPIGDQVLEGAPPTALPTGDRVLEGGPKGKGGGWNRQELAHLWTIWPLGDLYKTAKAIHLAKELREIEGKPPFHLLKWLVNKKRVLEMLGGGRYRFHKPRPEYGSHEFVEVFGKYSGIPDPSSSTGALGGGPYCDAGALQAVPSSDDGSLRGGPTWEVGGLYCQDMAHLWMIWPLGDLYKTAKAIHLAKELRKIEGKPPFHLLKWLVNKKRVLERLRGGRYRFRKPRPEYGSHEFVEVFGRYSGIPDPSSRTGAPGGGLDCGAGALQAVPSSDDGALCGDPKWEVGGRNRQALAHVWTIWPLGDLYNTAKVTHLSKELREVEDKDHGVLLHLLVHKKGVLEMLGGGRYRFCKPRPEYGSHEFVKVFGRYSGFPEPSSSTVALGGGPDCDTGALQAELRGVDGKDPGGLLKKFVHKKGVLEMLGEGRYRFCKPRPEYGSHEFVDVFGSYSGIPDPSSDAGALAAGQKSSDGAQV
eukprot:gene12447-15652_t